MKEEYTAKEKKIVTLFRKAEIFYEAEDYHKNYFNEKGDENPYCNIIPGKIAKMKNLFKDITLE